MSCWDWTGDDVSRWAFVIDTHEYAGNFERELCAYVVGRVDEHGEHHARSELEAFRRDYPNNNPFEDLVESRLVDPGDDGYHRSPCEAAPTPGRGNDGSGDCYDATPERPAKWPAFESVAIFLSREPTAEEVATMKARALAHRDLPKRREWDPRPTVLGFRIVREVTRATWRAA